MNAYEQLHPMCPRCGRLTDCIALYGLYGERRYFGELSHYERTAPHTIKCYWCETVYHATFFREQAR